MKIIFVTPYFYPKTGGLENYAYNIAKRLAKTNEVVVITSNHKDKQEIKEKIANLTIYRLPILFTVSHTPVNPFWYFKIKKIIKKENPDIINAHLPVPFIADLVNFIAPKKTIITYHNDLVKSNWVDYICKLYYLLLGNRTLKTSKGIIATSDYYVNKSPYLKKFKSKIAIVSPGVDLNVFNNKIKKGFLKNKNEKIVFVSQLNKTHAHKGLNYLLSSLKEVSKEFPKVHLYVCGKGDYLPRYKELVKKLNIENNVSFLGFVPDEDLPKIYRDVDIAVLPTYSTAEGFGMVLAEANACATPVIGSKIGGIPVVIENEYNGLLVPPKDVKELSKAIKRIFNDKDLSSKLSKNGVQKAKENWDWDNLAEKTFKIFSN